MPHDPTTSATPPRTGTVGMWLFLAALFMLFASSLVGYAVIRTTGERSPAPGALHLPAALWASTALVIAVSVVIGAAQSAAARGAYRAARRSLIIALALAAAFVTVQTPALVSLLLSHRSAAAGGMPLYGLIFFLVLLHALHVVGGIAALVRLTFLPVAPTMAGSVRHAGMYWHFLDLVWLAMFTTFLLLK